jgi:hypothetical protein
MAWCGRSLVVCVALAAGALSGEVAGAQEAAARTQPRDLRRAVAAAFPDYPWDSVVISWDEPRYKVEAVRFKARDETGIDWWGSDEVMVETFDPEGFTVSDEIGGIDSDDTHEFDPAKSCIVAVRPGEARLGRTSVCDDVGRPAPLTFRVRMWEQDSAFWGVCKRLRSHPHGVDECPDDEGADFIGRTQVDLAAAELETALPEVGGELVETVVLFPCGEGVETCGGNLPDYSFTYRVTRLPDVRTDFRSVLAGAIEASGAASATEAVVSGLRSLRAPDPREIEPQPDAPSD